MNLLESLTVALEGLVANKMRAALTMLGVIIGVGAVITMLSFASGVRERIMSNIQQMGTNVLFVMPGQSRQGAVQRGFGSAEVLTLDDAEALPKMCPSILRSSPEAHTNQQVKFRNQNTNTTILGVTPDYLPIRNYQVQEGKFFSTGDVKAVRKVAVIGPTTATNLFGNTSPVGQRIRIKGIEFQVIGLLKSKGAAGFQDPDDQIMIPVTTALRRLLGSRYVRVISAQAKSMALMEKAAAEIETALRKRHRLTDDQESDFRVGNQADFMEMASESSQSLTLLLAGIASVSLLVGGIGIMNIMLVSVTERTREIGLRMALGARRRDILAQFLIESMVLSLLGGLIGVIFGIAGAKGLGSITDMGAPISLSAITLSFGFAALVGIFFGFYPARQASLLDPIEALRYE